MKNTTTKGAAMTKQQQIEKLEALAAERDYYGDPREANELRQKAKRILAEAK